MNQMSDKSLQMVVSSLFFLSESSEASSQRFGPRFSEPFPAEFRFSNSTGGALHCAAHGQPTPRVTWVVDGDNREVQTLDRIRKILPNGTLHFPPFSASQFRQDVHGTSYHCRASNLFGTVLGTVVRVRGGKLLFK